MSHSVRRRSLHRSVVVAAVAAVVASFALLASPMSAGAVTPGLHWNTSVGTAAPPSTLGPYTMTAFGADARTEGNLVSNVPDPAGTIGFTPSLTHEVVGSTWIGWGPNSYAGSVYLSAPGVTTTTISLPAGTVGFYFYALQNAFGVLNITATAQDGTSSGPISVTSNASGVAQYFGVYTTGSSPLAKITVSAPAATQGVAIGQFGIAQYGSLLAKCTTPGNVAHLLVEQPTAGPQIVGVFCVSPYTGIGTYILVGRVGPGRLINSNGLVWFQADGNNIRTSGYFNNNNGASSFVQTKPTSATGKVLALV